MTQSRLLPTVLLAASSWLLISLFGSQQSLSLEIRIHSSSKLSHMMRHVVCQFPQESRTSFLTSTSPAASSRQSRTAMRGFKDDFYAWKDSLSKDEQALILKQAQNEFDKKFRKSDEFSQDLPEEKIQSFAKVLKKFFDNAARLGWYSAPPALESLEVVPDIPNVPEHAGSLSDVGKCRCEATSWQHGCFFQQASSSCC